MVVLVAHCRFQSEFREQALAEMTKMLEPSRAEEGCDSYSFFEDPLEANHFVFVEEWKSQEALDIHFATDFFKSFFAAISPILAAPPQIKVYVVDKVTEL